MMASDLMNGPENSDAAIHLGDSRDIDSWKRSLGDRVLTGVISSPPYLNNFDYADATRLELYFWGLAHSWKEMTTLVRAGMVTASTQQTTKAVAANAAILLEASCPQTANRIRHYQEHLYRERYRRPRGKEYDQLLPTYFCDLVRVLKNMKEHTVAGAPIALVLGDSAPYGLYINTPQLLADAATELGYVHLDTIPLRKRGLRWHTNGMRHSVALSEQLIVLTSPVAC
jgi:hypothetical protein